MGVATKAMAPPARLSRTEQAAFPRALFLHVEIFTHKFLKSCREAPSTACSVPEANCWCAHCGGGWRGGAVACSASMSRLHHLFLLNTRPPSAVPAGQVPCCGSLGRCNFFCFSIGDLRCTGPWQRAHPSRGIAWPGDPGDVDLTPTVRPPGAGRVGFPHTLTSILQGLEHPLCELKCSGCLPEKESAQDLGS